jgi:OmpA-OmpF porin, OOP family
MKYLSAACQFLLKGLPINVSRFLMLPIVLVGMAWPLAAFAQSSGYYLSGGISGVLVGDSEIEGSGVKTRAGYDPGFSGSMAVGLTFGDSWRTDAELTYRSADIDEIAGATTSSGEAAGASLVLNGYRDFQTDSDWTPYIGAGVGVMRLDVEDASPIGGSRINDDDWSLAAQGIVGTGYRINDQVGLYTDYRILATTDLDFTTTAGTEVESEYSEHRVMIGLRWSFGGGESRPKRQATTVWTNAASSTAASAPAKMSEPRSSAAPAPSADARTAQAPSPASSPTAALEAERRFMLFFDWDQSNLNEDARAVARDAAEASAQISVTEIAVTGHADRSGPDQYNMELSRLRAESVKAELTRLRVPENKIRVQWEGESQPDEVTKDGVREPRNRRVEIILK